MCSDFTPYEIDTPASTTVAAPSPTAVHPSAGDLRSSTLAVGSGGTTLSGSAAAFATKRETGTVTVTRLEARPVSRKVASALRSPKGTPGPRHGTRPSQSIRERRTSYEVATRNFAPDSSTKEATTARSMT